jgi:hypothetical protein
MSWRRWIIIIIRLQVDRPEFDLRQGQAAKITQVLFSIFKQIVLNNNNNEAVCHLVATLWLALQPHAPWFR